MEAIEGSPGNGGVLMGRKERKSKREVLRTWVPL